jgi:hypothetical protein
MAMKIHRSSNEGLGKWVPIMLKNYHLADSSTIMM